LNKKTFASLASIFGLVAVMALLISAALGVQGRSLASSLSSANNAGALLGNPQRLLSTTTGHPSHPQNQGSMPYTQGAQLMDGSGHPLTLRGAQIESPFNNIKGWQIGTPVTRYLNPAVFQAMVQQYHMNELRLPISNWIYNLNPTKYLSLLDQTIQQANSAGLYVVLDLHDDAKSGSPYGDNAQMPKAQDLAFWQAIATHYKDNPMVMFDLFNEPHVTGWATWLNGGGSIDGAPIVGFQTMVNAVRATGAKQIIIVEAGQAGDGGPQDKGWATVGNNTINDPNIMYSLHEYQDIALSPQQQDAKWGPILGHYPIYYGEWAMLPNGVGKSGADHCKGIAPDQADAITNAFLNYMTSRNANWNAWEFEPYFLIQSEATFAPTTLDIPWTCGNSNSHAGMGMLIKQFLTNGK
jgi:endoglucanase